jgi:hypothetical protein
MALLDEGRIPSVVNEVAHARVSFPQLSPPTPVTTECHIWEKLP